MDIGFAKVLDETGLAEDTMIVFTSDHGSNIGAHYQMVQKFFTAYEEATRVPFVISSPLLNPTDTVRQVEQVSSHVDLAPTLLGLAGFSDQQIAELQSLIVGPVHCIQALTDGAAAAEMLQETQVAADRTPAVHVMVPCK